MAHTSRLRLSQNIEQERSRGASFFRASERISGRGGPESAAALFYRQELISDIIFQAPITRVLTTSNETAARTSPDPDRPISV